MPTTTELTKKYLEEHPSIKDCLKHGIINYSKLARKIAKELHIEKKTSLEAILIACRRYETKLKDEKILEDKILHILKKSELEIKNKVVVAIIDKKIYMDKLVKIENKMRQAADIFYAIEGTKVFTIIFSEKYLEELKTLFGNNLLKISKNLAIITIKSPKDLEDTPGVIAFVSSIFSEHGINIVETMSCWTDTIFVISENDISNVMGFLKF
jgi:predicted regulator of amino acid metabolism with ACT domain